MPSVVITAFDIITGFGKGIDPLWQGLFHGQSAVTTPKRLYRERFPEIMVSEAPVINPSYTETSFNQLCNVLLNHPVLRKLPFDTELYIASTVGDIEVLEQKLAQQKDVSDSSISRLPLAIGKRLSLEHGRKSVVSAACASASTAIALASNRIKSGQCRVALVIAMDVISEFVVAGFNSLMALDPSKAKPFDANRSGLSLGDGAGFILLMTPEEASNLNMPSLAFVESWGLSNDANHITGPSRDGAGLAQAIHFAMDQGGVSPKDIAFISAHGTGTIYNDAMEMKAFKAIFPNPVPLYGIKGAIGHSLGAAGLIEACVAIKSLYELCIPPTVGLSQIDPQASGWAATTSRNVTGEYALCVNAGFGGINAAVCFRKDSSFNG